MQNKTCVNTCTEKQKEEIRLNSIDVNYKCNNKQYYKSYDKDQKSTLTLREIVQSFFSFLIPGEWSLQEVRYYAQEAEQKILDDDFASCQKILKDLDTGI